jgi:hypothetical protein
MNELSSLYLPSSGVFLEQTALFDLGLWSYLVLGSSVFSQEEQKPSEKDHSIIHFFFLVLGLELRAYILSHSTSPFL